MISVFDLEQLQELLADFYRITRIRITVFDHQFQELVSFPENRPAVCRQIRSSSAGSRACAKCDREACRIAAKQTKTYIYRCHAGLTEAITPLYAGNALIGYLLFGHIFAYDSFEQGWAVIRECCGGYGLDMEKLKAACESRPRISQDYINSAAKILHATASYLLLERMAILKEDSAAARLDDYLNRNYAGDLTAESICRELGLGRTRLYKLSNQLYGTGPSEQLRLIRIRRARELLRTSDLSIGEIAQACGFSDYNYFIAVFKKETGVAPGKYRRNP